MAMPAFKTSQPMVGWSKAIVSWTIGKVLYLSVPFTWLLPEARRLAEAHRKGPVVAGGPAVKLMPEQIAGLARLDEKSPIPPLSIVNPLATFTTRGCPNGCGFCAVPRLEGGFRELATWEPRPIICDNNLLAASHRHFRRVIDRLRPLPWVDFNQGLDARLFKPYHARQIAGLKSVKVRFSFDHIRHAAAVADAVALCRKNGLTDIGIYVLVGFRDTPADALSRLELVRSWGVRPNPMRYQPLDAQVKNGFLAPGWAEEEMLRLMHYWSRLCWLEHIPYGDFVYHSDPPGRHAQEPLFPPTSTPKAA
jgi:hypothetical protein